MTSAKTHPTICDASLKRAIRIYREEVKERRTCAEFSIEPKGVWLVDTAIFPFDEDGARRSYLTLAIDSATRDIVATHLDARGPCSETLHACLADGLKLSQSPTAIVVSDRITLDPTLLAELRCLKIELRQRLIEMGTMKGRIERALGRLRQIMRSLQPLGAGGDLEAEVVPPPGRSRDWSGVTSVRRQW
jgi:hypothetical protein